MQGRGQFNQQRPNEKTIVHPTKHQYVHTSSEAIVNHIHPMHTTYVNHHSIKINIASRMGKKYLWAGSIQDRDRHSSLRQWGYRDKYPLDPMEKWEGIRVLLHGEDRECGNNNKAAKDCLIVMGWTGFQNKYSCVRMVCSI